MGAYSENVKRMTNGKPRIKKTAQADVNISAHFIQVHVPDTRPWYKRWFKKAPSFYLHYDNAHTADELKYVVRKGIVGAAIFDKAHAKELIAETGAENLEAVPVLGPIEKLRKM